VNFLNDLWCFRQIPSQTRLSFRYVPVLALIALICWIITRGVIAAIVTEGVLPHFNLLVAGDGQMQDVTEPVPRAPLQPVQHLSLPLWKFMAIAIQGLFGVICVVFVADMATGFVNHLRHFES
jgi:putative flippase GtrA